MNGSPAQESLRLELSFVAERARIVLVGELDICADPLLAAALVRCMYEQPCHIDLDLGGVTFCDVAGLRAIEGAQREARHTGVTLHLVRIPPAVSRLLALIASPWTVCGR